LFKKEDVALRVYADWGGKRGEEGVEDFFGQGGKGEGKRYCSIYSPDQKKKRAVERAWEKEEGKGKRNPTHHNTNPEKRVPFRYRQVIDEDGTAKLTL